jgi:endonuclease/exonuclease/phosphatase family metal-dependent hydrolase
VAALLLLPWLAWAVVRTFGLEGGSRLVPLMTFTPYVGWTAPLPLVVALLLRRWALAGLALAVVAAFAAALLPRAFAGPQADPGPGAVTIHVMAANLFVGAGDARTVVRLVREQHVDVLTLEELTPDELTRLDAAGLRRVLPYRDADARAYGASGSGMFSRFRLRRLTPHNAQDFNAEPRALVAVPGAAPIDLQVIHPPPPIHGWTPIWRRMLGELPKPGGAGTGLRMLMGDFNATLDHAQLRRLLSGDHGYVDAADATGQGFATTWPAGRDFPPEITIDHVLIDPRMRADAVSIHVVPRSDHRAVVATLRVPRRAG